MTPAFKGGLDKYIDHFFGDRFRNKACRNAEDIGIIMLAGQGGYFIVPAKGRPDISMFIGSHGHTVSTAAEQYTKSEIAVGDSFSHRMCKIWIIYRVDGLGTEILESKAPAFQK